ncbi:MAG: hypothetical protein AAF235_05700 [Planctomycetota bacterium]
MLVCAQGILGALRVGENNEWLAMMHGVFGQVVFGSAVVLAATASGLFRRPETSTPGPTATAARVSRAVTSVTLGCVLVQLLFGAMSRHIGAPHATWSHAAFAFLVAGAVGLSGMMLRSAESYSRSGRALRKIGVLLIALIGAQFVLGFVVLWQVTQAPERPIPTADELATAVPFDLTEAIVTTLHQSLGAGILALTSLAVFWTHAIARHHAPITQPSGPVANENAAAAVPA